MWLESVRKKSHLQFYYYFVSWLFIKGQWCWIYCQKGQKKHLRGSVALCLADNPASHALGGYMSLSSAKRKCRHCLAIDTDIQTKVCVLLYAIKYQCITINYNPPFSSQLSYLNLALRRHMIIIAPTWTGHYMTMWFQHIWNKKRFIAKLFSVSLMNHVHLVYTCACTYIH